MPVIGTPFSVGDSPGSGLTNSAMLLAVENAIASLLSGGTQSYSIGGRSLTKLGLDQLYKMRLQLQTAVIREQQGSVSVAQFRQPE